MSEFNYRNHHFPNAVLMAEYILECDKQDKYTAEKERQEKLISEKETRVEEIQNKCDEINKLIENYNKDYNDSLAVKSKYYNPFDVFNTFR